MIVPPNSKPDYAWKPGEGVVPTDPWDIEHDPRRLPDLPELPDLTDSTEDDVGSELKSKPKLVKIAASQDVLMGLTDQGHVLRFRCLAKEEFFDRAEWEYVRDSFPFSWCGNSDILHSFPMSAR